MTRRETPRYRAMERIVVKPIGEPGARTVEAGVEFFFAGVPSVAMSPVNAPARAVKSRSIDRVKFIEKETTS